MDKDKPDFMSCPFMSYECPYPDFYGCKDLKGHPCRYLYDVVDYYYKKLGIED